MFHVNTKLSIGIFVLFVAVCAMAIIGCGMQKPVVKHKPDMKRRTWRDRFAHRHNLFNNNNSSNTTDE